MIFSCLNLAVPIDIMQHVVRVESSGNPYAIGVVGARLQRQPKNLTEAVATAKMLEQRGYNFSLGISQVNRHNLSKYGLTSYEHAFQVCPNLYAGSRILKECFDRSKDWGKSFSCYYSGNFVTGYKHGYVQKIFSSMRQGRKTLPQNAISVISNTSNATRTIVQMTELTAKIRQSQLIHNHIRSLSPKTDITCKTITLHQAIFIQIVQQSFRQYDFFPHQPVINIGNFK